MSTTRTIQRTPDLGIGIRLQRLPVAQAVQQVVQPPLPPEPPWWWGWLDEDGKRITSLEVQHGPHAVDMPSEYWPGLWVAVVEGAMAVRWDVSFTPTIWFAGVDPDADAEVVWEGEPVEMQLPATLPAEPDTLFTPPTVTLPDPLAIGGSDVSPWTYWPGAGDTAGFPNLPIPKITAAGNTLSVAQSDKSVSGVLAANAYVDNVGAGSVGVGSVNLALMRAVQKIWS